MSKKVVVFSTGSREDLLKMCNEYYYSTNWIITDDNRFYNTKTGKYAYFYARCKGGRWQAVYEQ